MLVLAASASASHNVDWGNVALVASGAAAVLTLLYMIFRDKIVDWRGRRDSTSQAASQALQKGLTVFEELIDNLRSELERARSDRDDAEARYTGLLEEAQRREERLIRQLKDSADREEHMADELARLRLEIVQLRNLLTQHGISAP